MQHSGNFFSVFKQSLIASEYRADTSERGRLMLPTHADTSRVQAETHNGAQNKPRKQLFETNIVMTIFFL